jgi:hypothetical protein
MDWHLETLVLFTVLGGVWMKAQTWKESCQVMVNYGPNCSVCKKTKSCFNLVALNFVTWNEKVILMVCLGDTGYPWKSLAFFYHPWVDWTKVSLLPETNSGLVLRFFRGYNLLRYNLLNTWNSRRMKTEVWTLCPSLELGTVCLFLSLFHFFFLTVSWFKCEMFPLVHVFWIFRPQLVMLLQGGEEGRWWL